MKKLIAFLIFLLAAMQGATAQEVLGQQIPLPLADDYKNTEFLPVAPSYSDILMMRALSSSELLAMPITPLTPMPFATEPPLANKYDASHSGATSMKISKDLKFTAVGTYRSYIGLMDVQSVSGNMQYNLGAITMQGGLITNRYHYYRGIISQYGISGQIVYRFNPNLSATIFGTYYNTNPFTWSWKNSSNEMNSRYFDRKQSGYGVDSHCYVKMSASYVFGFGKHVKQNNEASLQNGAGSAILE